MSYPCATCGREISMNAVVCPGCGEEDAGNKAYADWKRKQPKPVQPDALLAVIVGSSPMLRAEITEKIWSYIKEKGLQDPKHKTTIRSDSKLLPIFNGRQSVTLFEMNTFINAHCR